MKKLQLGGTLNPRKHIYIVRQDVEDEVFDLLRQGEYCNILSPRQVGKSSLVQSVIFRLQEQGIRTVYMDLAAELGGPAEAETWYTGLLGKIARDLRLDLNLAEWWAQQHGALNQKLKRFFEELLTPSPPVPFDKLRAPPLPEGEGSQVPLPPGEGFRVRATGANDRFVIFLDEIDATLKLPYTDDFFTAIRGLYNSRATEPDYERLSFCLIGVASANELIKDRRTTPYNIGQTVALRDFDPAQDDLSPLWPLLPAPEWLEPILAWTGGQPYLTLRLCQQAGAMGEPGGLAQWVEGNFARFEAVKSDPHFSYIADFLETRVTEPLGTLALYEKILQGKPMADRASLPHLQLKLAGLVKRDASGYLQVRNRIYARLFDRRWLRQTEPRRLQRSRRQFLGTAAGVVLTSSFSWLAYDYFYLAPARQLAGEWLAALNETASEARAEELFKLLTGQTVAPELGKPLEGYGKQAVAVYKAFWERRAEKLLGLAREVLAQYNEEKKKIFYAQRVNELAKHDNALLLSAAATVKQKNQVDVDMATVYFENRFTNLIVTFRGHQDRVDCIAFSPDSKYLATGSMDNTARLYDIITGRELIVAKHEGSVNAIAFSPDGRYFATASYGARLWDTETGNELAVYDAWQLDKMTAKEFATYKIGGNVVWSVAFSPNGRYLATGGADETARLWDIDTGKEYFVLKGHKGSVNGLAFSPDGSRLLTGSWDNARLWDMETKQEISVLDVYKPIHLTVAFSPDGKYIGAASTLIYLWDAKTLKSIHNVLMVGTGLAFSPDSRSLASYDFNGAYLFDIKTGKRFSNFFGHQNNLTQVSISNDGQRLATASWDGTARLWDITGSEKPDPLTLPPQELWKLWQRQLGLTLNDNDEVVPLKSLDDIRELKGWDPALAEKYGKK